MNSSARFTLLLFAFYGGHFLALQGYWALLNQLRELEAVLTMKGP